MLVVAFTTYTYAGTFEPDIGSYSVVAKIKADNNYIYVCRKASGSQIVYENICSKDEIPIKDGKIYISSYSFLNALLWVLFFISALFLIIGTLIGRNDDDIGWELEHFWEEALSTLIYCEEEDGKFYYLALGRLIEKRDSQISRRYRATSELNLKSFRDLYRCPKYKTKKEKRENVLNKIGIK